MAILTEDLLHTTVTIQNLSVAEYKDQKEFTSGLWQAPSGLLCSAALKDEVAEAEMKLKLWGDKMAILTEDFLHTTVSIQNLSVAQYKDQMELTSTPSTDRLLQKQENRSGVVQAIKSDEIVISNGVYDIHGYQPENITLGDEVTEAEMKLKLWGDKVAILTEDFLHTTVSI